MQYNEEGKVLYCSPNVVRVIKLRRMGWAGHVARMGIGEAYSGFRWGTPRERDHLGEPGVDGWIILRWIFRKWDVRAWTVLICLGQGQALGNAVVKLLTVHTVSLSSGEHVLSEGV